MVMALSRVLGILLALAVSTSASVIIEDTIVQNVLTGKWEMESRDIVDGPFGSGGTNSFSDAVPANNGFVTAIELRSGKFLDSIRAR